MSLPEVDRTHPGAVTSPRVHSEDRYDGGLGTNEMKRVIMKRIEIKARGLTFEAWSAGPENGPLLLLLEHLAEHLK